MVERRTWEEFRDSKLLWWINRSLHLFGWAVVLEVDKETMKVTDCYPARVKFRGFGLMEEDAGYRGLSTYLEDNIKELNRETLL